MRRVLLLTLVFLTLLRIGLSPVMAQAAPVIDTPVQGQALQGVVVVTGTIPAENFQFAELLFGYDTPENQTWFLITTIGSSVSGAELGSWDTTLLSDGAYVLRLVVTLTDGATQEARVTGLRVRNYSPVETDTADPAQSKPTLTFTAGPTVTAQTTWVQATQTPIPPNPVIVTQQDLLSSAARGGMVVAGLFCVLGIYLWVRSRINRS